jgi:hypothetical protein
MKITGMMWTFCLLARFAHVCQKGNLVERIAQFIV